MSPVAAADSVMLGERPALPAGLRYLRPLLDQPAYRALRQDPMAFLDSAGGFHSPLYLPDIERAVAWLRTALEAGQPILVLGDRDVDGVCSTAMLGSFLQERSANPEGVSLWVSDDGDDYGLSGELFQRVLQSPSELVILLDMGSSNGPEVKELAAAGKKVIILDHHQIHDRAPIEADCAFVNPHRLPQLRFEHANKIATVALAFKLLFAFAMAHTREWRMYHWLEDEGSLLVFRVGAFLGRFADVQQAKLALDPDGDGEWRPIESSAIEAWREQCSETTGDSVRLRVELEIGRRLLAALLHSRPRLLDFVYRHSDLTALGLMTDVAPLLGENRALVRIGARLSRALRRPMGDGKTGLYFRPGLQALLKQFQLHNDHRLLSRDIAWSIGPALNAAGRMGQTVLALQLLMEQDRAQADVLASRLAALNEERRRRTERNQSRIEALLSRRPELLESAVLFCFDPDLEPGVSGIVAARLSERFSRTVVYVSIDGQRARGSVRALPGVNAVALLERAADLLTQYGGHPEAAGFSLSPEQVDELEARLRAIPGELLFEAAFPSAPEESKSAALRIEPRLLGAQLFAELSLLEPFGAGNPEPVFSIEGVQISDFKALKGGLHAKFRIVGASPAVEAVAWRMGEQVQQLFESGQPLRLRGCLERSVFGGRRRLQFRVEAIAPHAP